MKKISICVLINAGNLMYSQSTYVDVVTSAAMILYSENLKTQQEKTVKEQTKLQEAQTWVASQMAVANSIQDKLLKGLSEVSGTLKNGMQVKNIYSEIAGCYNYVTQIGQLTGEHPEYAVFGARASVRTYEQAIKLSADVAELLKSGELNLATSGDRYKLLNKIQHEVLMLKLWLLTVKMNIERAISIGWFKSINPFQGYINTDKSIVENIMQTYKNNF